MAKLPPERRAIIWDFKQRLLDIVDEAKATAESQPRATPDLLTLLDDRIVSISSRVPALERSTQEIKADWNLL